MSPYKKIIAGLLTVLIVAGSLSIYPPRKASAISISGGICDAYSATVGKLIDKAREKLSKKAEDAAKDAAKEAGGVVGKAAGAIFDNKVPVVDESVEDAINRAKDELTQTEYRLDCKTRVERILLATLKIRILDVIVDQTINWIGGGGKPQFVTDLGGFLEDAGQAAIGDVALEVGLGDLCYGISAPRIQFQLETPVFSQRVSCTLDDIVGNIERFTDNFEVGGFIGYQELLKPQNNRWGLEIMASSEAERRAAEARAASQQEVSTGGGFLSTKKCLEWEARGTNSSGKTVSKKYAYNDSIIFPGGPYPDPSSPPPFFSLPMAGVGNIQWVCSEQRVTTPGQLLLGATDRAMGLQASYIINAETFEDYGAAIVDAILNRLIMEGVEGLIGLTTEDGPSGGYYTRSSLPSSVRSAGEDFSRESTGEILATSRENILSQLANASTTLADLKSGLTAAPPLNNTIADAMSEFLGWCNADKENHPQTCAGITADAIDEIKERETMINQLLTEVQNQTASLLRLYAMVNTTSEIDSDEALLAVSEELNDLILAVTNLIDRSSPFVNLESELAELQSLFSDCQSAPPFDPVCP